MRLSVPHGPSSTLEAAVARTNRSDAALSLSSPRGTRSDSGGTRRRQLSARWLERLPFADGSFDVALAILTIHRWSDYEAGLRELTRVAHRQVIMNVGSGLGGQILAGQ